MFSDKTIKALKWIITLLNSKNIPYQISGGFAAKVYGSTRELNDIDIEIPEDRFKDIMLEAKPYIVEEFQHHKNDKWDCMTMVLEYEGQIIDLSGAYEAKVSNKERTEWIEIPADFSKVNKVEVAGMEINVAGPEDMIDYKQYLDGDHQLDDIEAVKKYVAKK
ncbi:MAG: hypothetical protein RJB39_702 [Candidatus Parcubacteria bacterium]|jgi:hypothetical protein